MYGTPVDCVRLPSRDTKSCIENRIYVSRSKTMEQFFHQCDLFGTMSAAMEGAIEGILQLDFSLLNYALDADFQQPEHFKDRHGTFWKTDCHQVHY